jgi:hypothetical protein
MDSIFIADWNAGKSAAKVGIEHGMTRNAVIGKVRRLREKGVEMRTKAPRRAKPPRPGPKSPPKPRPVQTAPHAGFLKIPFADLGPNHCRYPIGDGPFLFCGQPKMEGSSYCAWCHERCHGAVREKTGPFVLRYFAARAA